MFSLAAGDAHVRLQRGKAREASAGIVYCTDGTFSGCFMAILAIRSVSILVVSVASSLSVLNRSKFVECHGEDGQARTNSMRIGKTRCTGWSPQLETKKRNGRYFAQDSRVGRELFPQPCTILHDTSDT